jgi:hypothetical protein
MRKPCPKGQGLSHSARLLASCIADHNQRIGSHLNMPYAQSSFLEYAVCRQTATFSQRQSTREEDFVLAGISLKEPVCGVYPAQNRDGQILGVRPCEALTSINLTSDLRIVRSKLPNFRGPPVMDGSDILLALSPMWRSAVAIKVGNHELVTTSQ